MIETVKRHVNKSPLLLALSKTIVSSYKQYQSKAKWKSLANELHIKLELGSGSKKGSNGWTTVDIGSSDITWDLRRGIPLPDNCVDRIYSSHLLEHIPYDQLITFLNECRRVLKPEGEFSVCVPNFRLYVDAYREGRLFIDREKWWQPASINTGSGIDQLNYLAYMKGEHKYMFDEENLVNTLRISGFSDARLREFDEELDLDERDIESIYAIASK